MGEKQLLLKAEIDEEEWEKTPPSVRRAFVRLMKELEALKEQEKKLSEENQGLQEKVNRNSQNSHSPPSSQLVKPAGKEEKKLFDEWYQVRDGTKTHATFALEVEPIRAAFQVLLQQGAEYAIGAREKTPLAKTVRTCRQLLKTEAALWLFVRVEGLEPTNNAAERAIRPAVLWRRVSFGSQSEAGRLFVARMLTVVTSLRSQNRNVLEFMTQAITAARQGDTCPSLLPLSSSSSEQVPLVAC